MNYFAEMFEETGGVKVGEFNSLMAVSYQKSSTGERHKVVLHIRSSTMPLIEKAGEWVNKKGIMTCSFHTIKDIEVALLQVK